MAGIQLSNPTIENTEKMVEQRRQGNNKCKIERMECEGSRIPGEEGAIRRMIRKKKINVLYIQESKREELSASFIREIWGPSDVDC